MAVGACFFPDALDQSGLGVRISPSDTLVYVAASYQAHGAMRSGNGDLYSSSHLRFAGPDSSASVTSDGVVTGRLLGRARVVLMREHLADTGWVSVVPSGQFAVSTISSQAKIYLVNADGSGLRVLAPTLASRGGASAWLPGPGGLIYESVVPGGGTGGRIDLFINDLDGGVRQLVPLGQAPRVSRDGWVYFNRVVAGGEIWRIRVEGIRLEQVTTSPSNFEGAGDPDPSPDATQLVYWSSSPLRDSVLLTVRTLAGGAERTLGIQGRYPRWAPNGTLIACWRTNQYGYFGTIYVVRADGTGAHQVSQAGRNYYPKGLDWSPDGQWLLARADSSLDLIHVATGLTMPLPYSSDMFYASWRPLTDWIVPSRAR